MATVTYINRHRKPITIGSKQVATGGTFTNDDADKAGVDVRALLKAGTVTVKPQPKKKPATKKAGK